MSKAKETIQNSKDVIFLNRDDVNEIKIQAAANERKRIRINMHHFMDSNIHEMIIVHYKDNYVRPHMHPNKTESFHIIEGELTVVLFDDNGNITNKIEMGSYSSGKSFCYRSIEKQWHTVIPRTDIVVFHETTDGPFSLDGTIQASWAPADSDQAIGNEYFKKLGLI